MNKRLVITVGMTSSAVLVLGGTATTAPGFAGERPAAQGAASTSSSVKITDCGTSRSDFITNDTTDLGADSSTFVPVEGMTKVITQHKRGCVIVDMSAHSWVETGEFQYITVTLDGDLPHPTQVRFNDDTEAGSHSAVFAFANVSAGNHTISLMQRSQGGGEVRVHRPAMHIAHR